MTNATISVHIVNQLIAIFFLTPVAVFAMPNANDTSVDSESLSAYEKTDAKAHFEKGQIRFSEGRYEEAIEHFEHAYEITHAPEILYNIGRCYEEQNNPSMAIKQYELYLRMTPDSEDQKDVEARIQHLQQTKETPEETTSSNQSSEKKDTDAARTDSKKRLKAFILALQTGPSFVILTPQLDTPTSHRHPYIDVDVLAHFKLRKWFAITGALVFGGYIEGQHPFQGRDATSQIGIGIGITMTKKLKEKLSIFGRIMVLPTAINRQSTPDRATWIDFQGAFGAQFHLSPRWSLIGETLVDGGPAFVIDRSVGDNWSTQLYLAAGFRLGAAVTF